MSENAAESKVLVSPLLRSPASRRHLMARDRERNNPDVEREGVGRAIEDEPIGRANESGDRDEEFEDADEVEDVE